MPQEETTPVAGSTPADQTATATGSTAGQTPTDKEAQTASQNQDDSKPALETLPKYWQDHIKDLRGENKGHRTAAEQARIDQEAKEAKDLEQRQEWEQLATKRQKEVDRLTPIAADAEKLGELITSQIDTETEGWPKEVKDTRPEGEISALAMYEWFTRMRPLAARLAKADESGTQQQRVPGNPAGPVPKANNASNAGTGQTAAEPLVNVDRRF